MELVQPIRDKQVINKFKQELLHHSYRDYILFTVGINTGLRISDILPLKVKDIKGTHITIKEKKTGKSKRFKINSSLRQELDKCEEKNITDWASIKLILRDSLHDYVYKKTKRLPMILPIIMEI